MSMQGNTPSSSFDPARRSFLATAAAAAGAAAVLAGAGKATSSGAAWRPAARLGLLPKPPGADEAIRMGVIGTGGMGTGHVEAFLSFATKKKEKVEIVALADVCKPRLENALKKCNEAQKDVKVETYGNYKELLARQDLHAVLIASPEHWHSQMAIDAIMAGKDVYLEKPMTLNLDHALALYDVVKANPSVMFQVGTQMMQLPKYQEARKLLKDGAIGKATFSQTSYCRNSKAGEWTYYAIDPKWKPGENLDWDAWCGPMGKAPWDPAVYARWRRYRKYSTGIIGDLLVHQMTPLLMAIDMGWPTRVTAVGGHLVDKAMENHDQVNLSVEFENEHVLIVAGSTCNEAGLETMIRGHKGNIYLGGRHCVVRPEREFAEEVDEKTIDCKDIGNDQDVHRLGWLQSIRTREAPEAGVELGTKIMVIVDLATRSLWDGKSYRFDPKTMKASPA